MKKFIGHLLLHLLLLTVVLGGVSYYAYSKMASAHQDLELARMEADGSPTDAFYDAYWWWKQARLFGLSDHRVSLDEEEKSFREDFEATILDTLQNGLNQYFFDYAIEDLTLWYRLLDSNDVDVNPYLNIFTTNQKIIDGDASLFRIGEKVYPNFYNHLPADSLTKDFHRRWQRFVELRSEDNRHYCDFPCNMFSKKTRRYLSDFSRLPLLWRETN